MWRGYRDCIDVDVLPDSKPIPNFSRAIYGYKITGTVPYLRTDHCQYTT